MMGKTIAGGANQSYFIDKDGDIWCFGSQINGIKQITDGSTGMIAVAAGYSHTLFLDEAGKVWGLGFNSNYQLGIADSPATLITPHPIPLQMKIVAIACGDYHSVLLDENGFVWAAGENYGGQCGSNAAGGGTKQTSFKKIDGLQNIRDIQAAANFSMFLGEDGRVWTCGMFPKNSASHEVRLISVPAIKEMAAGVYFCLLIDFEGKVWGCGENDCGQLGCLPKDVSIPAMLQDLPPIRACAAGWNFSVFLGEDDSLWTIGCNTYGTLCNGISETETNSPIKIEKAPPIFAVSCGWNHSVFLDCNGSAWCNGEGRKLPNRPSGCISVLTRIEFPKLLLNPAKMKNLKSARKI